MEIIKHLFARVVVRRIGKGEASFGWEIQGEETVDPSYVSPDKFGSMEAAYRAGQARLAEFQKLVRSPYPRTDRWRSRPTHQDVHVAQAVG